MSGTATEIDRLKTQVGALDVFVSELQNLEQWNMPSEWRERALRIRNASAPMFFNLVAALLQDALIQGLANILDRSSTFGKNNLTLEFVIQHHADSAVQIDCMEMLTTIRSGQTYADIKRARNSILSHSDHTTILHYDTLTPKDFPGLRLENLRSLVRNVMEIMARLTGKSGRDFVPQDWKGVDVLFKFLEQKQSGDDLP